jgi:hypothetical protein
MKNSMQKLFQKKYLVYWLLGVVTFISLGGTLLIVLNKDTEENLSDDPVVSDFDSCVEETGTVLESFPERCIYNGESYTNPRQSLGGDGLSDTSLPSDEERRILSWMEENNLNEYGDPQGTVYVGGTPLFDEATGMYQPLYEYLLSQHPEKPWLSQSSESSENTDAVEGSDQEQSQKTGGAYIFSDIDDWIVYEDPKFRLDYPGEPIGVQVADANGYPVRMYTFDGFEVFLGIDENPRPDLTCIERQLVGGTLFFCHNGDPQYLSVYEYMMESIVAL